MIYKIYLFFLAIFLIVSITAIEINAGDNLSIDIGKPYSYYLIEGNVSINISQIGNVVTIQTDKYMNSNSFDITFFDEKDEVIYSSGHSHKKKIINSTNITEIPNIPNVISTPENNSEPEPPIVIPPIKKNFPWLFLVIVVLIVFLFNLILYLVKRNIELKGGKKIKK